MGSIEMSHRYSEKPVPGVGVVVLRRDAGEVLLVRRGKPPAADRWALPGGSIELGESARAAAAREVQEETGLAVEVGPVVDVVDVIVRDTEGRIEYHYVLCEFLAFAPADVSALAAADDAAEVRWVRWDQVAAVPGIVERVADVVARAVEQAQRRGGAGE